MKFKNTRTGHHGASSWILDPLWWIKHDKVASRSPKVHCECVFPFFGGSVYKEINIFWRWIQDFGSNHRPEYISEFAINWLKWWKCLQNVSVASCVYVLHVWWPGGGETCKQGRVKQLSADTQQHCRPTYRPRARGKITMAALRLPLCLPLCLRGAVLLKTDMKTEPGHSGAPEGGPLADAATRSSPPLLPPAPGPEDSPEANRPRTQ